MSLEVNFRQSVFTYFMRCLDLNLNYNDGHEQSFQLSVWDEINVLKEYNKREEIKKKFKSMNIRQRAIELNFPALVFKCLNQEQVN